MDREIGRVSHRPHEDAAVSVSLSPGRLLGVRRLVAALARGGLAPLRFARRAEVSKGWTKAPPGRRTPRRGLQLREFFINLSRANMKYVNCRKAIVFILAIVGICGN